MKYTKMTVVVIIAFALGIIVSQAFNAREGQRICPKKEEAHHDDEVHCNEEGHHDEEANEIKLGQSSQRAIGLETVTAKRSHFIEKIPVTGQIAQDTEDIVYVVSTWSGVMAEKKKMIGEVVSKDETLCIIKINGSGELNEIKSPIAGTVIADFTKEGDIVDTVSSLYTVADFTRLLASFDVYEKDVSRVKLGQKLIVRSIAYPEEQFDGQITFISPRVDKHTHTIKIRAKINNDSNLLKLGMFITADVIGESEEEFIILPQEAVCQASEKRVVFVKTGDDDFQAKEVIVAKESNESAAIRDGLEEGELVVTKDSFLLKSEWLKAQMGEGCAE